MGAAPRSKSPSESAAAAAFGSGRLRAPPASVRGPGKPVRQLVDPCRTQGAESHNARAARAALRRVAPQLVEALNVLVSLLESSRADLRGHSSMVARLTRKTGERIGLSPLQVAAFTAAGGYPHDLGRWARTT